MPDVSDKSAIYNPLRGLALLQGACGVTLVLFSISILWQARSYIFPSLILNKLGPVAVGLVIISIGLQLIFVSALILLRRDLDTNKVQSLTKLFGGERLPDTFFSAENPLEDTLRNIGLLRNLVVRAIPRAGSLPTAASAGDGCIARQHHTGCWPFDRFDRRGSLQLRRY
jgi:hypothetical protein